MAKSWYDKGFEEGRDGPNFDPPMYPGHKSYVAYSDGYRDGERQAELNADREAA